MQMKENIQYQRSRVSNKDGDLDGEKDAADEHYIGDDDTYGPGCSLLLVSPGQLFLH